MNFLEWWENHRAMGHSKGEREIAEEAFRAGYRCGLERSVELVSEGFITEFYIDDYKQSVDSEIERVQK